MKSLVLDSNAIIALFDGDEDIRETISSAEKVLVPAVVLGEVQLGINDTKRGRTTQKALERFLDQPFVEVPRFMRFSIPGNANGISKTLLDFVQENRQGPAT